LDLYSALGGGTLQQIKLLDHTVGGPRLRVNFFNFDLKVYRGSNCYMKFPAKNKHYKIIFWSCVMLEKLA